MGWGVNLPRNFLMRDIPRNDSNNLPDLSPVFRYIVHVLFYISHQNFTTLLYSLFTVKLNRKIKRILEDCIGATVYITISKCLRKMNPVHPENLGEKTNSPDTPTAAATNPTDYYPTHYMRTVLISTNKS